MTPTSLSGPRPTIHKWRGPSDVSPGYVAIGRIIGPRGQRGELDVEPLTDFPERFEAGRSVYLRGRHCTIEAGHWHRGVVVLKLTGIDSAEQAQAFAGAYLELPESELRPLAPDTYYEFQLIGLPVLTEDGRLLGKITEILRTGSADVYVVRDDGNELLLPAIEDVIKQVDLDRHCVIVALIEGLT